MRSNRRRLLASIGAASTLTVGGCLGGGNDEGVDDGEDDENGDDEDTDTDENGDNVQQNDALHPRYGYPSTSMDEEQPVEEDYVVELLMEPQDEGPPEFYFEPAGLAIDSGDVVHFEFQSPDHAVAAFHEAFGRTHRAPEDAEPVSSPMMEVGTYWLCEFEEPGVWDLYCPPHEFLGMGMRLVVDDVDGPAAEAADPEHEGPERPPEEALAGTFNAEALDPKTILDEGEIPWEDVQ